MTIIIIIVIIIIIIIIIIIQQTYGCMRLKEKHDIKEPKSS